jgi:hypothetical protein
MEGIRGWFLIFHVKAMKVTRILRLGKKNSFIGAKLGGQGNSANSLSKSFQFYS